MPDEDVGTCAAIRSIPSKRQRSSPPESLSKDEVGCLLATPGTDTRKGLRESALLALLYDSACRAQELADMDVSSVTTGRVCHARIDGKGNKRRTVPLSPVKIVDREISDSQAARSTSASHEMASSKRAKNSSITSAGTRSPIASWGR